MSLEEARYLVERGIAKGLIVPPAEEKTAARPPKFKRSPEKRRSVYGKRGRPRKEKRLQSGESGAMVEPNETKQE